MPFKLGVDLSVSARLVVAGGINLPPLKKLDRCCIQKRTNISSHPFRELPLGSHLSLAPILDCTIKLGADGLRLVGHLAGAGAASEGNPFDPMEGDGSSLPNARLNHLCLEQLQELMGTLADQQIRGLPLKFCVDRTQKGRLRKI